jgi:hypothetical protein
MKKISTINMNPKDKGMFMGNILGSFGNDNIRSHHIVYFEEKLVENNENKLTDLSDAPNYYAWLCLMSEHLFWAMRSFCFRQNELEHDDFTLMYNPLMKKFSDTCRNLDSLTEAQLQNIFDKAVKVLELRHAIIHKGFPNLLPIVFEERHVKNKPSMSKSLPQKKFTKNSTKETIKWFSNPNNFYQIKEEFGVLIQVMRLGPGFSIGF